MSVAHDPKSKSCFGARHALRAQRRVCLFVVVVVVVVVGVVVVGLVFKPKGWWAGACRNSATLVASKASTSTLLIRGLPLAFNVTLIHLRTTGLALGTCLGEAALVAAPLPRAPFLRVLGGCSGEAAALVAASLPMIRRSK